MWSRRSTWCWSRNARNGLAGCVTSLEWYRAPLLPRIIEKCLASDRIVIDTVVSKYCNHTPLHRQSVILERELGLKISRATLDGWVLRIGELLIPMVAAMRRELISGSYIQADETPVDVQTHEGDTRGPGTKPLSVSLAIQSPRRICSVRLPPGSWTEGVP